LWLKKKLSRDQKRKQRKQRRVKPQQPDDPGKRLIRRVRQHGFEQKVVRNPPGQVKMSEVLREFVAPYWHVPDNEEAMRKLPLKKVQRRLPKSPIESEKIK
jgi:hypothetical protein